MRSQVNQPLTLLRKLFSLSLLLFISACATKVTSTAELTTNCYISPSSLVNWWNGSSLQSTILYDISGLNHGTTTNVSSSVDGSITSLAFNSWGSLATLNDSSQPNLSAGFTVAGWFKSNPATLLPATRTLISKGIRSNTISTSQFRSFDTSTLNASITGFGGSAFDGRYIYLAPGNSGIAARYDTLASLTSSSAWMTYDVSSLNAGAKGFTGAVYDGKYIYFVPNNNGSLSGLIARYDTSHPFNSVSSWDFYDLASNLSTNLVGYAGAAFDGRYIYSCPGGPGTSNSGWVTQYDTTKALNSSSAWTYTDINALYSGANHFNGIIFDGRYIYCIPVGNPGSYHGIVAQFDTTKGTIDTPSGWSFVDLGTAPFNSGNTNPATGYGSGIFDGKFIYFLPFANNSGTSSTIARFDTSLSLDDSTAWSYFDISTATGAGAGAKGYCSGAFDGQYLSLYGCGSTFTRYNTKLPFTSSSSWTFSSAPPNAIGKISLFDGRYLYFVSTKTVGQQDTAIYQTPFELNANSATSDGHSMTLLGPTFQITTHIGTYILNSTPFSDSGWHYLVGTYDRSQMNFYIDGTLVGTKATQGTLLSNTWYYTIGGLGQNSLSFGSNLNDIQFYNAALTLSNIQALYTHTYDAEGLCQ